MLTFDATEQINEVSRTTRTTTQVITRYFGRWPQTKIQPRITTTGVIPRSLAADNNITFLGTSPEKKDFKMHFTCSKCGQCR